MDNANAQWRRPVAAPILRPGFFTQMLATRCESQIGADWMCVPAARNLHWSYIVLYNAVGLAVQHIPHDGDLDEQVSKLLD
eukprot:603202-Karenia_brevis.AAC.1